MLHSFGKLEKRVHRSSGELEKRFTNHFSHQELASDLGLKKTVFPTIMVGTKNLQVSTITKSVFGPIKNFNNR